MEQLLDALKRMQAGKSGSPNAILGMVHEWKGVGENLFKYLVDSVSEIESRERSAAEARESLEKRLRDVEEREKGKRRELAMPVYGELVESREAKLDEQLESVREHIGRLEAAQGEAEGLRVRRFEKLREVEKRELELEKRLRGVRKREKEFELYRDGKLGSKEEVLRREREEFELAKEKFKEGQRLGCGLMGRLELALSMLEGMKGTVDEKFVEIESWENEAHESLAVSFREADLIRKSLEKEVMEFEEMKKEFNLIQEEKIREVELKERKLSVRRAGLLKELNLRDGKLTEKFKEIESWEIKVKKSLTVSLSEGDSVRESLEKRFREFEEMEREFNSFRAGKMHELELKEQNLSVMRTELLKKINITDEMLTKRFKKIDSWETMINSSLTATLSEADLIRESLEKRCKEFEETEKEFNLLQEDKMQKLEWKEPQLGMMKIEILNEVKLMDEKLTEQQKLGNQLVAFFQQMLAKRLKEIELQGLTRNVACETFKAGAKESQLYIQPATVPLQVDREEELQLYQEKKMRELALAEENLRLIGEEFIKLIKFREGKFDWQEKLGQGLLDMLELARNNVKDINAMISERFKEVRLKLIELDYMKDLVGRKMDELKFNQKEMDELANGIKSVENTEISRKKELKKQEQHELKEGSLESPKKKHECKEQYLVKIAESSCEEDIASNKLHQPEKCLFDNHAGVQMHMKTLDMFINSAEKDLESMGDEAFKVLFLSSDPAKLVLDAIQRFYPPHLSKGDTELNMRRKVIILLDQLTERSPNIRPCVREAAIKLAGEWKSKMRATAENQLEVLGFLHLLAAYNLASCFDKDELFDLLKIVAQHKQIPQLCRILGLMESIPGFIQNLIKEKKYLLASTYIHGFELGNVFPQAAVLKFYVQHSKLLAKAKCNWERSSYKAQVKAMATEIADLRVAIEHIIKYGLESEYLPSTLAARINQLEKNRASLRNAPLQNANKRQQQAATKEGVPTPKAQMHLHSKEGSSPGWKPQHQIFKRKRLPATTAVDLHHLWSQHEPKPDSFLLTELEEIPMAGFIGDHKRCRINNSTHLEDFHHLNTPTVHQRLGR